MRLGYRREKRSSLFRGLGSKLALLNTAISGAILIVIALVTLGIAEGMVANQNARELGMYVRSVYSYLQRTASVPTQEHALLQIPERYKIYLTDEDGEENAAFTSGQEIPLEQLKALVSLARAKHVVPGVVVANKAEPYAQASIRIAGGEGAAAGSTWWIGTTLIDWLTNVNGKGYRVSSSVVQMPEATVEGNELEDGMLLVLQDRTDEMAVRVRLRWLFAGMTLGGMGLIVITSLNVSAQAIRPIDESIRKQRAFVAAASHELRTPVAALNANAEVLADAPLGEYAPYLESIRSVSERMTRLIMDLIDLARSDAGELSILMEPTDAEEAVSDALRWMRPLADKRGIRVSESLEPAYLTGDAGRLRQALLALMDNALRYTPEGGEINVTLWRDARYVKMAVADTGIGIPDESKPLVFDRFYRLDAARDRESGGAGLGLSVVKQLTEGMDGGVAVRDNPGGGTIFELTFRAAE